MENLFKGLGIALVTPFTVDGEVDYKALDRIVDYQMEGGADFLCVLGSTAETPCLTDKEKQEIKNHVVSLVRGRLPLLLGFGDNCTQRLIQAVREFDFSGIDGILSVCPYYNKPSAEGIFRHYQALAASTSLPVVAYNVPGRTGTNITAPTTLRMARELDNVVAIKEASGKIDQIDEILKNRPEGFDVISGDDSITYELLSIGAVGVISVIGNALPKEFGSMVHKALSGRPEEALSLHHRLSDFYRLLSVDGNPSGIKALLSDMGLCENTLRLPLVPARKETTEALRAAYESLKR